MSKSRKKSAWGGNCSGSDKKDKTFANKSYRRLIKSKINEVDEFPRFREVTNMCTFKKDGKHYFGHVKYINNENYNKWLRK